MLSCVLGEVYTHTAGQLSALGRHLPEGPAADSS